MPLFEVTITETRVRRFIVDDVDHDFEAESKIEQKYSNNEINLDNDYITNFEIESEEI